MTTKPFQLCVIGGNGFVGSAVCRAGLSRGWNVVSLSRTGSPYTSPAGHQPTWTQKVDWRAGSAYDAQDLAAVLPDADAVVHTLGILLESQYKGGKVSEVLSGLSLNPLQWGRGGRGPLESKGLYERINRDSAIAVLNAFASTSSPSPKPRPFAYLSAEDVFRPIIPSRYIESKRAAEQAIDDLSLARPGLLRPLFIRPSLIYHPHIRPITTLPATLIDLSAHLHRRLPLPLQAATLARIAPLQTVESLARLVSTPPVHVDTVGEAICRSIEEETIEGVVDVKLMRRLAGYKDEAQERQEA